MQRKDIIKSLKIKAEDIVLEIGPGNMPYSRSNIYLERDIFGNKERAGHFLLTKPCVLGDAQKIPFKDKSIDYIFCAQVLEHASEPEMMISEIIRVGKRGYIETPNFHREFLFGWPFHKWIIDKDDDGSIVFYENTHPQYFGDLFHRAQVEDYWASLYFDYNFDKFNTFIEWESNITFRRGNAEDLIAKYSTVGNRKLYVSAENRQKDPCSGELTPAIIVDCVPWLRKHRNSLLFLKQTIQKILKRNQTTRKTELKEVITRMTCFACGDSFETYLGQQYVTCISCANSLKVENELLLIDQAYLESLQHN